MKKTLSIILAAAMVLGMMAVVPMTTFAGDPTTPEAQPIKTEAEFLAMDPAGNYYLDADLVLTKTYGLPEGEITTTNQPKVFTGMFDGNGKTVTISTNAMFAEVKGATISNFTVNGDINATEKGYSFDSDGDYSEGKIKLISQDFYAAVTVVADGKTTLKGITSNVNFTSTLEDTRWGAIAAESRTGHELLIEDCVSNGKIEANSYVGGIYGWCASKGNSTIKNCINTGDIHITAGYCGGITSRLGGSGDGGRLTVEGCVNTGNVTADKSNACGIVQYSNTPITMKNCVNTGDITAAGNAAGIHSSLANLDTAGVEMFVEGCVNTGKITATSGYVAGIICNLAEQKGANMSAETPIVLYVRNNINLGEVSHTADKSNHVGGIVGYVWASQNKCYSVVENNINYGKITITSTGKHYAGQIVAYTNSPYTVVKNNIGAGSVAGPNPIHLPFIGLSSADITKYTVSGNYYVENSGMGTYYSYADDEKYAANRVELANAPAGAVTFVAADKFADGTVATALNTAVGSTMFEVRDGKTLLVCDHTKYPTIDGACAACGFVPPRVKTEAEFLAMDPAGIYILDADITLTKSYEGVFSGYFDGNGKTVTISTNAMFLEVKDATILNLTVKGDLAPTAAGYAVGSNDFFAAVAVVANGASTFKKITSNVNFTATLATTRYGAIAATSAKDHALLIEDCVNNGNIVNDNYAGGIYGWSDKIGNSTIKNCVNNGNVTLANGYGAGIVCRLAGPGEGGAITVENCVNNGNITVKHDEVAGILAYANTPNVNVIGCVNNGAIVNTKGHSAGIVGALGAPEAQLTYVISGNVNTGDVSSTGSKYVAGIVANLANPKIGGTYTINNNINTGDITGGGNDTGGIVGYAYGRGTDETGAYAIVNGNVNTGTITNSTWASQILCYTNQPCTTITNNIAIGKVVLTASATEPGADAGQRVIIGLSSADITKYTINNNYYIENDGTVYYSYATSNDNAANRIAYADRPAGSINIITADKIAESLAAVQTAIGATLYEVNDGTIVKICNHADYLQLDVAEVPATCTEKGTTAGTKCSACGEILSGCEEIAIIAHTFVDGKCTVCQADDPDYNAGETTPSEGGDETTPSEGGDETTPSEGGDETTPGTTDEEGCAGCGGFSAFAALIAIISAAGVVIIKKKA